MIIIAESKGKISATRQPRNNKPKKDHRVPEGNERPPGTCEHLNSAQGPKQENNNRNICLPFQPIYGLEK